MKPLIIKVGKPSVTSPATPASTVSRSNQTIQKVMIFTLILTVSTLVFGLFSVSFVSQGGHSMRQLLMFLKHPGALRSPQPEAVLTPEVLTIATTIEVDTKRKEVKIDGGAAIKIGIPPKAAKSCVYFKVVYLNEGWSWTQWQKGPDGFAIQCKFQKWISVQPYSHWY